MSALGGVGQQVAGDIFELGKSVVKGTVKAVDDIATQTIETAITAPAGVGQTYNEIKEQKNNQNQDQKEALKRQKEKRQFEEVRGELAEYTQRKKQLDAQIAQEKNQEEQEHKQKESYEKQKKDSFLKQLMKRLAGGSHGETDRQKE